MRIRTLSPPLPTLPSILTLPGFNSVVYFLCLIVDCCSSRQEKDRFYAFDRLRMMGVYLNTTEGVLLSIVQDKQHPQFKAVQGLIREQGPDTGLMGGHTAKL